MAWLPGVFDGISERKAANETARAEGGLDRTSGSSSVVLAMYLALAVARPTATLEGFGA